MYFFASIAQEFRERETQVLKDPKINMQNFDHKSKAGRIPP